MPQQHPSGSGTDTSLCFFGSRLPILFEFSPRLCSMCYTVTAFSWAQPQLSGPFHSSMQSFVFRMLVFTAGAVTLGVELSAARLLEPWFGNSQIVWAALIGLILAYLALGAWLGGKLADRFPSLGGLLVLMTVAGLGVALTPAVSRPILRLAAVGLNDYLPGLLAGTLLGVLLLFSLPVILLGAVSPWAVRLAVTDLQQTGRVAGQLYAIGACGSIVGTFLPVLWLIPSYGTRWSFYLLAFWLLAVALLASLLHGRSRRLHGIALLALGATLALALIDPGSVRAHWDTRDDSPILYEDESLYNYILVRAWGSERHLQLNEGVGIHSVYHPDSLLSQGIWDYFLLAPLFRTNANLDPSERILVIGLAAGTAPNLYSQIYGPVEIVGVELDPQIIEVGRRYFDMTQPNLTTVVADGRRWLQDQPEDVRFDIVLIDAYRPPYIPFHLTTVEFFQLARKHMSEPGILMINVGRSATDFALVNALAATLASVFPSVLIVDEPGPPDNLGNSLVVAANLPITPETFAANAAALPSSLPHEFRHFALEVAGCADVSSCDRELSRVRAPNPPAGTPVFTDDRAPVEQLVHRIVWNFFRGTPETPLPVYSTE